MRVIVVGGGIMGLASAWALARAGHEPVIYEQGSLPNPRAASADRHRVIRYAYGADHGYACMVAEAFQAWERLWADLGVRHYVETGHLTIAEPDDAWLAASRRSLDLLGVTYETMDGNAVERRFPMCEARRVPFALLTPSGGALLADRIVQGLIDLLRSQGHALHGGSRIVAIDPILATVRLEDGRTESADALLVTAGAWTRRLVPEIAARAVPSRQVVIYMRAPDELRDAWRQAPVLSDVVSSESSIFYVIPPVAGTDLKFGDHRVTLGGDPDGDRVAAEAEIGQVMRLAGRRLRDIERYRRLEPRVCFYTCSPDERFTAHTVGQALVLTSFSGHGFKFGALVGERTAERLSGVMAEGPFARWLASELAR
jgi:glycine/D-amino acid oxidase-like deaminating enzyme